MKKNIPLVSICMTCYNHEKYVRQALESAINQTYPNIEILISDDGSTDHTRDIIMEIVKAHPEKQIKTYFAETNTTFRIVEEMYQDYEGKYIAGFSGDDFWGDTAVGQYVEFMENHEEYAASFSVPEIILDQQGGVVPDFRGQNMSRYELFESLFWSGNRICNPSMFVRGDMWKRMGGWKLQYRQLQDYEMWLQILQKYEIYFFDKGVIPIFYRIHTSNLSFPSQEAVIRDFTEKTYMLFSIMEEMEDEFFLKAFEKHLVYPVDSERFCLKCEKLMVLCNAPVVPLISAEWYYFSHIKETDFAEHIEKDYKFSRNKFYNMTGMMHGPQNENSNEEIVRKYSEIIEKQNQIIDVLMNKIEELTK